MRTARKDSMMIAHIVDLHEFRYQFKSMGRSDQFSYEGLEGLYSYLIEYAESIGETVELDVIGLCCEYTEYDSVRDCCAQYGLIGDTVHQMVEALYDHTQIVWIDSEIIGGRIIIQDF